MLLKRIELSGFKSFAQKTTLEFTTPITAVVGPNGSGKSNIAEAIRFVLGEQSMKSLRSKRGEDLVFHGSGGARSMGRASVTIVFDNSSRLFDIDYDEVALERVVHRDGTNYYAVNGSRQRLKDILELLSAAHIGTSSHHIISQGETDRILSVSIKERRSMIEDALGLRIYQSKRAESERKLAKTRENMQQLETLRREISPHLSFLEKQMEKYRQAQEIRAALAEAYTTYLAAEDAYLRNRAEELADARRQPEQELSSLKDELQKKEQAYEQEAAQRKDSEQLVKLERALSEAREKRGDVSRKLGRLEGQLEFKRAQVHEEDTQDSSSVSIPHAHITSFAQTIRNAVSGALSERTAEAFLNALSVIKEASESFFASYEEKTAPNGSTGDDARKHLAELEQEQSALEEELKRAEQEETDAQAAYRQAQESREESRSAERLLEREIFKLRNKKHELESQLESLAREEERLEHERSEYRMECSEAIRFVGREALPDESSEAEHVSREEQASRRRAIERYKIKIEEAGTGGEDVKREYEEVKERDSHLARELEDMEQTAESLERLIDELGEKIDTQFKNGIQKINDEFQSLFSAMFGGGTASLSVVSPPKRKTKQDLAVESLEAAEEGGEEDELETGIDITINLPTKRIKGLQALSGGERALTSIALIFAMTQVNPPPFLVLDETDAALDESNAQKYGAMLERLAKDTQFIIITHNRETMTKAGVLYGVTANKNGISRVLSVKLDEAEGMSKE